MATLTRARACSRLEVSGNLLNGLPVGYLGRYGRVVEVLPDLLSLVLGVVGLFVGAPLGAKLDI